MRRSQTQRKQALADLLVVVSDALLLGGALQGLFEPGAGVGGPGRGCISSIAPDVGRGSFTAPALSGPDQRAATLARSKTYF